MPIPIVVIAIPLIKIMTSLNLVDTHLGLALLNVSFMAPLTTWMAASYIQTIPTDLEDAAYIDGCSRAQAFFKVILPLAKPAIGAVAIIAFLSAWNQFFLALIFAPANAKQLTVVVAEFVGKHIIKKSLMAAAGTLAMLPPIVLVLFFNKFIIGGLTKGAVK
jgi:multiple sugar transport system permease protein